MAKAGEAITAGTIPEATVAIFFAAAKKYIYQQ